MDEPAPQTKRAIFDSLIFKMSFFVSVVMLFSLLVISVVFIYSERQKVLGDIVKTGKIFANSTIQKIYGDYVQYYTHPTSEDFQNFKTFTQETLKNNEDIVGVSMAAFNGRILFDSGEFTTGKATGERNYTDPVLLQMLKSEQPTSRTIVVGGKDVTEIVVPLPEPGGGTHIISFRYLLSNRSLTQRMNEIYRQLALVIIPLIIIVVLLSIPFTITFTKSIRVLTRAAEDVRAGNLDVQTNIKGKDEIGTLATIFDQMVVNIKSSRAKLEEYSKTLEQQVAERTRQLEESKKTLEEKLDELGRMNNLMVGRELKMTELKREIEGLQAKLGATGIPPQSQKPPAKQDPALRDTPPPATSPPMPPPSVPPPIKTPPLSPTAPTTQDPALRDTPPPANSPPMPPPSSPPSAPPVKQNPAPQDATNPTASPPPTTPPPNGNGKIEA